MTSNVPAMRVYPGPIPDHAPDEPLLRPADRCDRCCARAYVLVVLATGDLMFCAHHFRAHEAALREQAQHIVDERAALGW